MEHGRFRIGSGLRGGRVANPLVGFQQLLGEEPEALLGLDLPLDLGEPRPGVELQGFGLALDLGGESVGTTPQTSPAVLAAELGDPIKNHSR